MMNDNQNGDASSPLHILELNVESLIQFEPVSKDVSVFYDETNSQVFDVQNNGEEDVVIVKGPDETCSMRFKLSSKGNVLSIKFSPSCDVLALQRSSNIVEFINFANGHPAGEYSQTCRSKNSKILGFIWTETHEIVFITEAGIEFYQIMADRKLIKCLKTFSIAIEWFVFQPQSSLLLLASGTYGNVIQAFQFRPGSLYKLCKFEVEWSSKGKTPKLYERDVALAVLYGKTCLLVLRHHAIIKDYTGAHIVIYTFQKEGAPHKTNILLLNLTGRFAINIVDDLVIVHHQTSKSSIIFDIRFPTNEVIGAMRVHSPILPANTIKPPNNVDCELYSSHWVIFQPNIIIDARMGSLWLLNMNLEPLVDLIHSKPQLVDFLMFRRNSKSVILKVCKNLISAKVKNQLGSISLIFNKLNQAFKESNANSNQGNVHAHSKSKSQTIIDQNDMTSQVFSVFIEKKSEFEETFIMSVLFEYIYSLSQFQIPIEYFVYEFLLNHLVRTNRFYQLHQFLQYHVFTDSKPLACLILSLKPFYEHSIQLGLDMLKRLSTANEEIVEVLLSQYQVARALRFIQSCDDIDSISARKFLEVAMTSDDSKLFYSVFKFFELRNLRIRGSALFVKGEHCETFVEHFHKLFGTTSSLVLNEP